jgi:hypothetical protein
MSPETYALWRECWCAEHPGRIPPTLEQTNRLMEMFDFTAEELFATARDDNREMSKQ